MGSVTKGMGYIVPDSVGNVDWKHLKAKRDAYVKGLNGTYLRNWENGGIKAYMGLASFVDKNTVKIEKNEGGEQLVTAPHIVVACGGEPTMPKIPGIEHT